jgi:DNA-directed RNA polymerase subunit RPC12/RpoP
VNELVCSDCGRAYSRGPDVVIPTAAWVRISPSGNEGGILCPNCMHDRLVAAGFQDGEAPGEFKSGPMASSDSVGEIIQRERAERSELEVKFLIDRMRRAISNEDYHFIGRSSNALVVAAFTGDEPTARPLDLGDLRRCENTFDIAPAHIQKAMKPWLEKWQAELGVVRT